MCDDFGTQLRKAAVTMISMEETMCNSPSPTLQGFKTRKKYGGADKILFCSEKNRIILETEFNKVLMFVAN